MMGGNGLKSILRAKNEVSLRMCSSLPIPSALLRLNFSLFPLQLNEFNPMGDMLASVMGE